MAEVNKGKSTVKLKSETEGETSQEEKWCDIKIGCKVTVPMQKKSQYTLSNLTLSCRSPCMDHYN